APPRALPSLPTRRSSDLMPGEVKADWSDPSGKICVLERGLPGAWAGKKLAGLNEPGRFWLTAVTRLGTARIVDAGIVGQEGDMRSEEHTSELQSPDHLVC